MPKIPLIRDGQQGAVPNLPAYKPNNLRAPRVQTGAIDRGLSMLGSLKSPSVDPALAALQSKGLSKAGEAFMKAGDMMIAAATAEQEMKNKSDVTEAMLALEKEKGNFDIWREQNAGSPHLWRKEWEGRSSQALERVLSKQGLSPAAMAEIKNLSSTWNTRANIEVGTSAAKGEFARAKSMTLALLDRASLNQDGAGHYATRKQALEDGILEPHEEEALAQAFDREGEAIQAKATAEEIQFGKDAWNAALADPWQAKASLQIRKDGTSARWPHADPGLVRIMDDQADRAIQRKRNDNIVGVYNAIVMHDATVYETSQMLEGSGLTPAEEKKVYEFQAAHISAKLSQEPMNDMEYHRTRQQILNYDKADDPDLKQWSALMDKVHTGLPGGKRTGQLLRSNLSEILYRKAPRGSVEEEEGNEPIAYTSVFRKVWSDWLQTGEITGERVESTEVTGMWVHELEAYLAKDVANLEAGNLIDGKAVDIDLEGGFGEWIKKRKAKHMVQFNIKPSSTKPEPGTTGRNIRTKPTDRSIEILNR